MKITDMRIGRRDKGFTLVEMTIVFVIMSLVLTVGVSALTTQYETVRLSSTKKNQEIIHQALINFISRNGRLPCPAVRTLSPGSAGYGVEAATPGCIGTASSGTGLPTVVTGIVPFVSLGLSDDIASDGYLNRFTYQVVLAATNSAPMPGPGVQTLSGMRGYITLHSASPGTAGLPPAGNQTNFCQIGNYNPCAAVALILSHGKNGLGAFTPAGIRMPMPTSADELANTDDDGTFIRRDSTEGGANHYDDIVLAMTTADLLDQLARNGTIKDARAMLNATFDAMLGETIAKTTLAQYGISPNKCYIATGPSTAFYDPWGKSITATVVTGSSICASGGSGASTPILFTSTGPDESVSADDISRPVTTAEMQMYLARSGF